jgi:hypothetical protein
MQLQDLIKSQRAASTGLASIMYNFSLLAHY